MTREEYLNRGVESLRPIFALTGAPIAKAIRVTCGFPPSWKRTGDVGDCIPDTSSADSHYEILISPTIADPVKVFETLIQQLCRTTAGAHSYTSTAFDAIAHAMGLMPVGKWRIVAGAPDFADRYVELIAELGEYPHAEINLSAVTTQTTRMLKAYCPCLGANPLDQYKVRITSAWANQGMPICPLCNSSMILEGTV